MTTQDLNITAMPTPNPNTIKFLLDYTFFEKGSIEFNSEEEAQDSPLAEGLLEIDGLSSVFIGTNFVSISKTSEAGWETIIEPATNTLKAILSVEKEPIDASKIEAMQSSVPDDNDVIKKIKQILDDEIRPAIAMDGGDCQFHSMEDGVVTLQLQGACSSCPSATLTLKMGIENRLKEEIPEVEEVKQLL